MQFIVVREFSGEKTMQEAFEQQFPEGEAPTLEYQNEKLAVYIGNRNYVNL